MTGTGTMAAPALALDAVSFSHGERVILDRVSLAVAAGRVVGLLGPNGAGKSTALRLAAGLWRPSGGAVRLGGRDLATLRRGEVARSVALLPQEAALPAGFTGREAVAMGRAPYLGWFGAAGPADFAAERHALARADAEPFADRPVETLSGGERRRLGLARALAQQPTVLLLDEPAAHLDLNHALAALATVSRLAREEGIAVLAVLHDLNLASEFCDELVVLAEGRVVARGTPAEVVRPATLAAAFAVDLPVVHHPESGRPVVLASASRARAQGTGSAPTRTEATAEMAMESVGVDDTGDDGYSRLGVKPGAERGGPGSGDEVPPGLTGAGESALSFGGASFP